MHKFLEIPIEEKSLKLDEINNGQFYFIGKVVNRVRSLGNLFIFCVITPVLGATFYFGLMASDVYVSESRFFVVSPDKPSMTGIGVLLKSAGFSSAGEEVFAARDYVVSRDAMNDLNKNGWLKSIFGNSQISVVNRFDPFGFNPSTEALYEYYQGKISVEEQSSSAVNTLKVSAFTGQNAYDLNLKLLKSAESLVNHLNERARRDLVRFSEREVKEAEKRSTDARIALSKYRNAQRVVDPEKQAGVQLQMISKLQDEIIGAQALLSQLRQFAPSNSQVPALEARIAQLERSMAAEVGKIAGGGRSLSASAVEYQRLELDNEFAAKQLAAAMMSYQQAKNEAQRQQVYIERIVEPNRPDDAAEPRRIRSILAVAVFGFIVWGILKLLIAGVKEHLG